MRKLISLLAILFISGCGTTSSVKMATQLPDKTAFVFLDERPTDQRLSRTVNGISGENVYFGDDNLSPSAPALLKAWLQNKSAIELTGKQITLLEFTVNIYDPSVSVDSSRLNTAAASVPGGYAAAPFAGLLIGGIERIRSEKIVYIKIQGKVGADEFFAVGSERFQGRVTEENVQATLIRTLDKAVAEVRQVAGAK